MPHYASTANPWPHRMAVLLVMATFPLIWIGGLVTTYDAGMAVPDWPTTYGYNLFLYPWQTWLFGPWDLLIEHGPRLLGAAVGLLTIAFAVILWRSDSRGWIRVLALVALAMVIGQGILGGQRVLLNSTRLAMYHGCLGPTFFAICVALACCTSRIWTSAAGTRVHPAAGKLHRLALLTPGLALGQLILGAQLRHIAVQASSDTFRAAVTAHLLAAGLLTLVVLLLFGCVLRSYRRVPALVSPAVSLVLLITAQLLLGMGTWVVNYSWPVWMAGFRWAAHFTIQADGMLQAVTVTAHTAMGSLILAVAVTLALRSTRLVRTLPLDSSSTMGHAVT